MTARKNHVEKRPVIHHMNGVFSRLNKVLVVLDVIKNDAKKDYQTNRVNRNKRG